MERKSLLGGSGAFGIQIAKKLDANVIKPDFDGPAYTFVFIAEMWLTMDKLMAGLLTVPLNQCWTKFSAT